MALAFALLAVVTSVSAVSVIGEGDAVIGSLETQYSNQPVVVVRKTTYYEPELVAVVVERGIDGVPEDSFLIQNYADVLSKANKEVRLCKSEKEECLEKPVTRLLVPRPFQSLGVQNFFDDAAGLPWVSTLNKNVEVYNKPILVSRPTKSSIITEDTTPVKSTEVTYKAVPIKPEIYRSIPAESVSYVPYQVESEIPRKRPTQVYRTAFDTAYERPTQVYRTALDTTYPVQRFYTAQRPLTTPVETASPSVLYSQGFRGVQGADASYVPADQAYYTSGLASSFGGQPVVNPVEAGSALRAARPFSTDPYYVQRKRSTGW